MFTFYFFFLVIANSPPIIATNPASRTFTILLKLLMEIVLSKDFKINFRPLFVFHPLFSIIQRHDIVGRTQLQILYFDYCRFNGIFLFIGFQSCQCLFRFTRIHF